MAQDLQQRVRCVQHRHRRGAVEHRERQQQRPAAPAVLGGDVGGDAHGLVVLLGEGRGEPVGEAPFRAPCVTLPSDAVGERRDVAQGRPAGVGREFAVLEVVRGGLDVLAAQMPGQHPFRRRVADLGGEVPEVVAQQVAEVVRQHHDEVGVEPDELVAEAEQLFLHGHVPGLVGLGEVEQEPVTGADVPGVQSGGRLVVRGVGQRCVCRSYTFMPPCVVEWINEASAEVGANAPGSGAGPSAPLFPAWRHGS
ncbi:hypothetical protein [Streptomyces sp. G45]|uniref:hypothetical protein n=1 Tax=Streptomyces sp. G45 TaxID=3406627 RepID=UPI003C185C1D